MLRSTNMRRGNAEYKYWQVHQVSIRAQFEADCILKKKSYSGDSYETTISTSKTAIQNLRFQPKAWRNTR